jgi:endonuclease/exonuclease/phosphatase family metal-dependent hydrolase
VTRRITASCWLNASASEPDLDHDFEVAAFNAHWGIGRYGRAAGVRFDVARVVRDIGADLVVVPEAWRDPDGVSVLDGLEDDGYRIETLEYMRLELRPPRKRRPWSVPRVGSWELGICSRFPVVGRRLIPMGGVWRDPPGPRFALSLTVTIAGVPVEVTGLHTSSKFWRLAPMQHLLTLRRGLDGGGLQILAGDFNFWGPPVAAVMRGWDRPVRGRTFPSERPHSQIDHVLVRGGIESLGGEVLAETPSDHRPIRARLRLPRGVT